MRPGAIDVMACDRAAGENLYFTAEEIEIELNPRIAALDSGLERARIALLIGYLQGPYLRSGASSTSTRRTHDK